MNEGDHVSTYLKTPEEIVEIAQDFSSRRFGGQQKFTDVHVLSGSGNATVLRVRVANQPFLQERSLILKYVPTTGDSYDDAALLREIVAYQFTTSLIEEVRPGPMLLGYDYASRLIILSDSGSGDTFEHLLVQKDPALRQQILRNLGQALGRMHAGTAGRDREFAVLLARMLALHPEAEESWDLREKSLHAAIEFGLELVDGSGITVPASVRQLAQDASTRLHKSRSRAFTPYDLSPDNIIVGERTEFLDYEWAGFRDVSFDLACVIAGFPQYVGTYPISDDEVDTFLAAWRGEVKHLWPWSENEDDLHERITAALLGWAFSSVAMLHHDSVVDAMKDPDISKNGTPLLRSRYDGPFTEEERYIRKDLYETFEALSRFAAWGRASDYTVVKEFASQVAEVMKYS